MDFKENYIHYALERRILHGLACEWEVALWILPQELRIAMKKPLFRLGDMKKSLGCWTAHTREICLNRDFVMHHPWDSVREILRHEMAHQLCGILPGGTDSLPHGPEFRKACELLRADPRASGRYESLHETADREMPAEEDKILLRVQKLMALAQSSNRHEAEAAMQKAHELTARHNIDLISRNMPRDFVSVFPGRPALRHFREEYVLAMLLEDFYFVQGIWVPAYVLEKGKMGRALEISGTDQNVKLAGYVHDFVHHFTDRQWKDYSRGKNLSRYRKSDFAVGILSGFRSRLESGEGAHKVDSGSRALVRMEDPLLHQYMNYRYPHTNRVRSKALRYDPDIVNDGVQIGKKLVISKGITGQGKSGKYLPVP
ncbi:MAG: SprT-like domain-containing protein [Desulfococcaceae bacterium]